MSRLGDCWDNAVAERFFRVLGWGNKLVVVAQRRPDALGTSGRAGSGLAAAG